MSMAQSDDMSSERETIPLSYDECEGDVSVSTWGTLQLRENVPGHRIGETMDLAGPEVIVGRHHSCNIVLTFSGHISNRHMKIAQPEDSSSKAILTDTSSNGTLVNGVLVGLNQTVELNDGDVICILRDKAGKSLCSFKFTYTVPRKSEEEEAGTEAAAETVAGFHPKSNAEDPSLQERSGDRKYHRICEISSGSFGTVYKAQVYGSDQQVAIKVINKHKIMSTYPQLKNGNPFEQEAELLQSLDHPNIIRILDFFQNETEISLVLELAEGGDLLNFVIENGPLDNDAACSLFRQIVDALTYLHSKDVAHRDLKPENLLLNKDHTVAKITDFGTSKVIRSGSMTGTICGTIGYIAPEIWSGNHTKEVDIWSLGCILFFVLTGKSFFLNYSGKPHEIGNVIPRTLMPEDDRVCPSARDLILRMVVVNPALRLSLDKICLHPWFNGARDMPTPLPDWIVEHQRLLEEDEAKKHAASSSGLKRPADSSSDDSSEPPAKRADTRPLCKYGANCYRKNPEHFKKFRHPPPSPEPEPKP